MTMDPRGSVETPHFIVHGSPGTFAMQQLPQITARLEKTYGIVIALLGSPPESATRIQVWLEESEPENSSTPAAPEREVIRVSYRPESPGEGLDRAVLLALLARIAGPDRPLPPLFVEGLHGCLLQKLGGFAGDKEILAKLGAASANHALPTSRALLAGPDERSGNLYYLAAQSFIAYVLERHGPAPMVRVLKEAGQDGGEAAMRLVYGRAPAKLAKAWGKTLQGETPAGVVTFLGMAAPYLRPYKRQLAEVSLYLVISVAFGIGLARMQGVLLDKALIPHDTHALVVIMAILVAAFALVLVTSLRQNYLTANISENVLRGMRARMYAHVQRLHAGFFQTTHTGDITSRMTSDMAVIGMTFASVLTGGTRMILMLAAAVITIVLMDWKLAMVALVGTPLLFIGGHYLGPRVARAGNERQKSLATVTSNLQESLGLQPVTQAFGLQERMLTAFQRDLESLFRAGLRQSYLGGIFGLTTNSVASAIQMTVLGVGAWLVIGQSLTAGVLFAFLALMGQIIGPLQAFSSIVQSLQQASGAMRRIDELLKVKPAIVDAPDAAVLPPLAREIAFEGVDFAYAVGTPILRGLNLRVKAGANVALVGPSGCGKSTVLNLIMRFYDPDSGSVRIDGTDARDARLDSLRQGMGVVFQESVLFNLSIRENIRMGNLQATDGDVEDAARAAEMHDMIMAMPEGYETVVGERGGKLSGGQRQRLAIARAILRNPALLLLDEATSALDPRTEAAINKTLERLSRGRTTISVTHRLSSITHADCLYVLDGGSLVEQGTHAELLGRDGLYAQLWHEQGGMAAPEGRAVDPELLRSVPLLSGLADEQLEALAGSFSREPYETGDVIITQGDPGTCMYVLHSGQVEVLVGDQGGGSRVLAILSEGDYFGEMALLHNAPRMATIRALGPVEALRLETGDFRRMLDQIPALRERLEATVGARMKPALRSAG